MDYRSIVKGILLAALILVLAGTVLVEQYVVYVRASYGAQGAATLYQILEQQKQASPSK